MRAALPSFPHSAFPRFLLCPHRQILQITHVPSSCYKMLTNATRAQPFSSSLLPSLFPHSPSAVHLCGSVCICGFKTNPPGISRLFLLISPKAQHLQVFTVLPRCATIRPGNTLVRLFNTTIRSFSTVNPPAPCLPIAPSSLMIRLKGVP